MKEGKIDLLVVPTLFPRGPDDMLGIFVLDYLRAVEPHCNIKVLDLKLSGDTAGLRIERMGAATVYRCAITRGPVRRWLKPFLYARWLATGWRLAGEIGAVDIIHAHGSTLAGTLGLLLGRKLHAPVVITEHGAPGPRLRHRAVARFITRRAAAGADIVLPVSAHLQAEMQREGIEARRWFVSFNPIDTDLFTIRPDATRLCERKNILYVGRLVRFKGAMRTLHAFRTIAERHPGWQLTVIGDGPDLEEMRRTAAADHVLQGRVSLLGQRRKEEIARQMNAASFLVLPSERETFGLVVGEAMASGLPVIVGEGTASTEFVDPDAGFLVTPNDVAAISKAMERMIERLPSFDPARIRAKIVPRFAFAPFGLRMREVYESLL